jgi:hypothetical protein
MPVTAFTSFARIGPIASSARACGSRSPAIIALIMAVQDWLPASLEATDDSLHRASSSSFSSRCQYLVRSWVRCTSWRVQTRIARISGGGANDGRSSPISVSRAIHAASSLSVFGRPGRFRAREEFTSCTLSPASSSTANQTRQ